MFVNELNKNNSSLISLTNQYYSYYHLNESFSIKTRNLVCVCMCEQERKADTHPINIKCEWNLSNYYICVLDLDDAQF